MLSPSHYARYLIQEVSSYGPIHGLSFTFKSIFSIAEESNYCDNQKQIFDSVKKRHCDYMLECVSNEQVSQSCKVGMFMTTKQFFANESISITPTCNAAIHFPSNCSEC